MKWLRGRLDLEVPPLEVPNDLNSGTEARLRAEDRLTQVLKDDRGTFLTRAMQDVVQENHIRQHLMDAHGF